MKYNDSTANEAMQSSPAIVTARTPQTTTATAEIWAVIAAAARADRMRTPHPYLHYKKVGQLETIYVIHLQTLRTVLKDFKCVFDEGFIAIFPYSDGIDVTGLEFLDSTGKKMTLRGSIKRGSYWTVKEVDDPEIILVSEGVATACSCAAGAEVQAGLNTKRVLSVASGGNNNIESVITTLKNKHSNAQIIVCCDLDAKTRQPDVIALNAARNTGSLYAVPDIFNENEGKDFNDLHVKVGVEFVGISLHSGYVARLNEPRPNDINIPKSHLPALISPPDAKPKAQGKAIKGKPKNEVDLPDGVSLTRGGRVLLTVANAVLIVDFMIGEAVAFDQFAYKKIVKPAKLPWRDPAIAHDLYDRWGDRDSRMLEIAIEQAYGITFSLSVLYRAIDTVIENHGFNNVRERCEKAKDRWDKVDRLSTWLSVYLGVSNKGSEAYLKELGHAWMRGVIARIMYPGCQRDDTLVLIGSQGCGKSSVARAIGRMFGENTYTNTVSNFHNKDAQAILQGKVIVELAEMSAARTSSIEEIKNFTATCTDIFRPAYGHEVVEYKRTCSFIATTNDEFVFKDITGNRRFWPCKVGKIDLVAFKRDLPQLLCQAAHECITLKLPWHIADVASITQANNLRDGFFDHDDWTDSVLKAVANLMGTGICPCRDSSVCKICEGTKLLPGANKEFVTVNAIATAMGIPISQQTRACFNRIRGILQLNGFRRVKRRLQKDSNPVWGWLPPLVVEKDVTPSQEVANSMEQPKPFLCRTCKWANKASEATLNGRGIWCTFDEVIKAVYQCQEFISADAKCQDCYLAKDGKCQLSGSERLLVPDEVACGYFKGKDFKPPMRPVLPATSVNTMHNA